MPRSKGPTPTGKRDADPPQVKHAGGKIAVALTYKPDNVDQAPVVSASGEGYLAERIIEMAEELGIPVQSDSDLVELLAATEIGEEIPVEAFIAVAEILRYVYALNGRSAPVPSQD